MKRTVWIWTIVLAVLISDVVTKNVLLLRKLLSHAATTDNIDLELNAKIEKNKCFYQYILIFIMLALCLCITLILFLLFVYCQRCQLIAQRICLDFGFFKRVRRSWLFTHLVNYCYCMLRIDPSSIYRPNRQRNSDVHMHEIKVCSSGPNRNRRVSILTLFCDRPHCQYYGAKYSLNYERRLLHHVRSN